MGCYTNLLSVHLLGKVVHVPACQLEMSCIQPARGRKMVGVVLQQCGGCDLAKL
jgi:hypothetical protein